MRARCVRVRPEDVGGHPHEDGGQHRGNAPQRDEPMHPVTCPLRRNDAVGNEMCHPRDDEHPESDEHAQTAESPDATVRAPEPEAQDPQESGDEADPPTPGVDAGQFETRARYQSQLAVIRRAVAEVPAGRVGVA